MPVQTEKFSKKIIGLDKEKLSNITFNHDLTHLLFCRWLVWPLHIGADDANIERPTVS